MIKSTAIHRLAIPITALLIISIGVFANIKPFRSPLNLFNLKFAGTSCRPSAPVGSYMEDVEFTVYGSGGTKKMTITGKKLVPTSAKIGFFRLGLLRTVELREAIFTVYGGNLPMMTISSRRAVLSGLLGSRDIDNPSSLFQQISFSDYCLVVTSEHRSMVCERLRWNEKAQRLFASGECELTYDGKTISADTITSDLSLKNYSFSKEKNKRLKRLARKVLL